MSFKFWRSVCGGFGVSWLLALISIAAWGQHGSEGRISVTVFDPTGSVVQGAQLELRDLSTNEVRKGDTQGNGIYSFVNLQLGTYRLSVSKGGFKTQVFDSVLVQATKTTDINCTLAVGALTETVVVSGGETPLVETSSSAIGSVIDLKSIENLPISGRDLTAMTQLVPGYTGTLLDGGGTWNGLPSIAQGNNIDGVVGSAGRMKFTGAATPAVEPRIENIQEMTVQTDQLDLNQGFGNATMQINFVTRRGTNSFHGRVYEDHRNSALNANDWVSNSVGLPKNHFILNEFGGSLGGPIIKDKLFFFGTFAMSKQPGTTNTSIWVLTPEAQAGNFSYTDTNNVLRTVNVLQLAANCASCGAIPSTVNSQTASTLQLVNNAISYGALTPLSDPNFQQLSWHNSNPITKYFPAVRVDYTPVEKLKFNLAWNMTKDTRPGASAPNFPGPDFDKTGAGNRFKSYTAALGVNYMFSPTLVNEFRGGFLYTANFFGYNGVTPTVDTQQINWNFPNLPYPYSTQMNGTNFQIPTGSYYPVFNASDTVTWQHRAHTLNFGFSWWREQNHYYNGVLGFPALQLGQSNGSGLVNGDPALGAFSNGPGGTVPNASGTDFSEAQALYSVLAGRVAGVGGSFAYDKKLDSYCQCIGTYNLNELQKAFGLFVQDSWRIKPTLTLNYGLRWDFTWPDYDLTGAYHSAPNDAVWGPSGVNNLFNPGSLNGTMNPMLTQNSSPAKPWYVTPQPALGIAWNPHVSEGMFGKVLGGDKTVIRAGFSLRRFTEPQQYFWNQASDYGAFYFQSFFLNANNTGQTGTFAPGSLALGDTLPAYGLAPQQYLKTEPVADFTFLGGPGVNGVEPHIRQPYTESWNLGIQRQLGDSRALEFRYVGNRSLRQWITINQNEINIFENGFLDQFKAAQGNLAINQANGITSFANNGFAGQQALPVFDAAFAGEASGGTGIPFEDYANSGFINDLQTGQAGSLAGTLASINGPVPYICNLVGPAFTPCVTNAGYTGAGAGYPINYFQANPFAQGIGLSQLVAKGYSNYNALQVDFRQQGWHGLQFDANYTWSHTLGLTTQNNWQGGVNTFTLRNLHTGYAPALFDIRHAVHINGTYDLPFGKGRQFANKGGVVDRIVGGWTVGSIFTYQTGNPFPLQGGYNTFNDGQNPFINYGDGGVVLTGVTPSQLQSSVGVYHIPGTATVAFINPKYLASASGGGANTAFINPNTAPGTIGQLIYLHGPRYVADDISVTKHIPITESINFRFQMSMLNAFNHPSFQPGAGDGCSFYCYAAGGGFPNVQSSGFGIGGTSPSYRPRNIEFRANLEF